MRMSYDPQADAAYLRLTDIDQGQGPHGNSSSAPPGDLPAYSTFDPVVLDWRDGRLVGLERSSMPRVSFLAKFSMRRTALSCR